MTPSLTEKIRTLGNALSQMEKWALVALLGFLVGFSFLQIILRNFFSTGLTWSDALSRHIVLWISFLGATRATSDNKHIRVDLLPRFFPRKAAWLTAIVIDLFSALVSAVLFYASWNFIANERMAGGAAFGSVPLWWAESIFPFSFGLMTLRFGLRFITGFASSEAPPKVYAR